jgi:hypothetical protein
MKRVAVSYGSKPQISAAEFNAALKRQASVSSVPRSKTPRANVRALDGRLSCAVAQR